MHAVTSAAAFLLMALAAQAQIPGAQTPAPTFRSGIDIVEVVAFVSDTAGRPVTDLTRDEFLLFEDGVAQPIIALTHDRARAPSTLPDVVRAGNDVHSNRPSASAAYALVLDDQHVAAANATAVTTIARDFLAQALSGGAFAEVIHTGAPGAGQPFTRDPSLLNEAVDRFRGRKLTVFTAGVQSGRTDTQDAIDRDDQELRERTARGRLSLEALRAVADTLTSAPHRRKVIVFVSEGIDVGSRAAGSVTADALAAVIGAAARSGVVIYTLDPRRVLDPRFDLSDAASDSLRTLAEQTGGFMGPSGEDGTLALQRILRDGDAYYTLGFTPRAGPASGQLRRIDVRVTRDGLRVRARRGHAATTVMTATSPELSPLARAANSPVPVSDVPLTIFAAPYKDRRDAAAVLLYTEIAAGDFSYRAEAGTAVNTLEVVLSALDQEGRARNSVRHTLGLTFTAGRLAEIRERGLRFVTQLSIPPGRYQLRLAAHEAVGGATGSVLYDLHVPDFYRQPLSMSGPSLYVWPPRPEQPNVGAPAPLIDMLPWPPTTARAFARGDTLALFAELYDQANRRPSTIEVATVLRDGTGDVRATHTQSWSSTEARGRRGEYGFQAQLPLLNVPPGDYVLAVTAQKAGARTERVVPVRIR